MRSTIGDKKRTKRVPKGTSEYQAAWIEENEEEEDGGEDDEDDDEEMNEVEDIPAAEESDSEEESEDEKEDMAEDTVTESEAGNTEDYDMKHVNFRLETVFKQFVHIRLDLGSLKSFCGHYSMYFVHLTLEFIDKCLFLSFSLNISPNFCLYFLKFILCISVLRHSGNS